MLTQWDILSLSPTPKIETGHVLNTTKTFALQPFLFNLCSVNPPLFNILSEFRCHIFHIGKLLLFLTFYLCSGTVVFDNIYKVVAIRGHEKNSYHHDLRQKGTFYRDHAFSFDNSVSAIFPTLLCSHSTVVQFKLKTVQFTLKAALSQLNTAHCILKNVHNTLHNESCKLHTACPVLNGLLQANLSVLNTYPDWVQCSSLLKMKSI